MELSFFKVEMEKMSDMMLDETGKQESFETMTEEEIIAKIVNLYDGKDVLQPLKVK